MELLIFKKLTQHSKHSNIKRKSVVWSGEILLEQSQIGQMINESGQTDKLLTWPAFSAPAFSSKKTNSFLPLFHFESWIRIIDSYILLDKCLTLMVTFKFFLWMHFEMFPQLTCVGKCKATFHFFTVSLQNECSNSSIKI